MAACTGLAAIAVLALASSASAVTITENGPLSIFSSFTLKNTGKVKVTGGFGVECDVADLRGIVTQNNTVGAVKGEIPVGSASFTNEGGAACASALGATTVNWTSRICIEYPPGTDTVRFTGCSANLVFDLKAAGINCKYEASLIAGTFSTNLTPAKAVFSNQPVKEVGGLFFCPDTGELDMTLDHYTADGATGLTLS